MHRFTQLFTELDRTTRTSAKVDALRRYFEQAPAADAAWGLHFLSGRRFKRTLPAARLREWVAQEADLPLWLVEESYSVVGDLSEALALLLPDPLRETQLSLAELVNQRIAPLRNMTPDEQRETVTRTWEQMDVDQRLVWNKLVLGNFRVGVAKKLVTRALAEAAEIDPAVMAHRLMGPWEPTEANFRELMSGESERTGGVRPYPFFLAHPLNDPPESLGDIADWQVEWKWDGIRAQLVARGDDVVLWSRGEEMIGDQFPEIKHAGSYLSRVEEGAGVVLDGEVVAWGDDRPLPFNALQKRLGRKVKQLSLWTDVPVMFLVFDLLEHGGRDLRDLPLVERRRRLESVLDPIHDQPLRLSPLVEVGSWEACGAYRDEARERPAEGLMLKRRASPYGIGRARGDWWKWKVDPHTIDAVLIHAQHGHGKRAGLYTDYTFGVWDDDQLVPIAKAYSGLTDREIREVDRHIRRTTIDRRGPVRVVEPQLVFELAFQSIAESGRHKAGLALRFPRMARWRHDKKIKDADTLETIRSLEGA